MNRAGRYIHTVRQELWGVAVFVATIWIVFLLDYFLPLESFALVPRRVSGLFGIGAMTFLHGNLTHILSNTVPLFVLLTLLAGSRARSWSIVVAITVLGGLLLWLFGRNANHIGASLLIFGLISFLIASGLFFEPRPLPAIVAVIVGFMYGLTLFTGIVPHVLANNGVSWDGHLCGAIAGVGVAAMLTRQEFRKPHDTSLEGGFRTG